MFGKAVSNSNIADVFAKNFWQDWKQLLPSSLQHHFVGAADNARAWDFKRLARDASCNGTTRASTAGSKRKKSSAKSMVAIVDGTEVPISRPVVDRAGLFVGHGDTNKWEGRIRRRLTPSDVTVNLSPVTPGDRRKWGSVISDASVSWLAKWTDSVTGKAKYVFLAPQASANQAASKAKFERARMYASHRPAILRKNTKGLGAADEATRQCATCMSLLDAFAIRAGHDGDASTRGVATLRRENVQLLPNHKVSLDFVGKDSLRFRAEARIDAAAWSNIASLIAKRNNPKPQGEPKLFWAIDARDVNAYLETLMPGLTAKVIRTYKASCRYQHTLKRLERGVKHMMTEDAARGILHTAATNAAALCNHQKTTKTCAPQLDPNRHGLHDVLHRLDEARSAVAQADTQCWAKQTTIQNYIDPRITLAFCARHGVDVNTVFSPAQRKRFTWAIDEGKKMRGFVFCPESTVR
jgi:DNA topoisomerase I